MKGERRTFSNTKDRMCTSSKKLLIKTPSSKRFPKDFFQQTNIQFKNLNINTNLPDQLNPTQSNESLFTFRVNDNEARQTSSNLNQQNQDYYFSNPLIIKKTISLNQKLLFNPSKSIKRIGKFVPITWGQK